MGFGEFLNIVRSSDQWIVEHLNSADLQDADLQDMGSAPGNSRRGVGFQAPGGVGASSKAARIAAGSQPLASSTASRIRA